jgi:hypothetical protein
MAFCAGLAGPSLRGILSPPIPLKQARPQVPQEGATGVRVLIRQCHVIGAVALEEPRPEITQPWGPLGSSGGVL